MDKSFDAVQTTLIEALLAEQRQLTAVEEFAHAHERHAIREPRYRKLLPTSAPAPGQQYAFEVDLDQCSGCKACVTACHSLNGLDEGEVWREVGTLVSDDWRRPFQQVVTTACHHCVEPGCLKGCPVLAYEKDAMTGIVRHLDDQCIGCEYCVMMCPYDVPKYSERRGIVRKCDLCSQRLAVGEEPACVQACPNEAIRITLVTQESVRSEYRRVAPRVHLEEEAGKGSADEMGKEGRGDLSLFPSRLFTLANNTFLPSSPDPALTLPTTRFVSKRPLPFDLIPSDAAEVRLQPAHWPLAWMLVLTQMGVGSFALLPFVHTGAHPPLSFVSLGATFVGLGVSVIHLGRPTRAWRGFLGLRTSWLSREIVAFGLFAPLAALVVALSFSGSRQPLASDVVVALLGGVGVICSGMVYHATQRALWRGVRSVGRFLGTMAVLGLAAAWAVESFQGVRTPWLPWLLLGVATVKLAGEHCLFRRAAAPAADRVWPHDGDFDTWSLAHSAVLMRDRLGVLTRLRFTCGLAGGVVTPLLSVLAWDSVVVLSGFGLVLCLLGELVERHLFFRVVVPPRMPGPSSV